MQSNGLFAQFSVSVSAITKCLKAFLTSQIISPITVIIALYSMPNTPFPFKLESKYFMAAVILMIGFVQLLFLLIRAIPSKPSWWWRWSAVWRNRLFREGVNYGKFILHRFTGRGRRDARNDEDVLGMEEISIGTRLGE